MRIPLTIRFLLLSALCQAQSFDTPGKDPARGGVFDQPNEYARLIHGNGLYPASAPNRTEYYLPVSGGNDFSVYAAWNLPEDCLTISDRFYTPNQRMIGVPRLHSKGITGAGVKIVVLESGYTNAKQHPAIGEVTSYYRYEGNTSTFLHTVQVLSVIGAKPTGSSKLIGTAYGAELHIARTTDIQHEIEYATSINAKIATITTLYNESVVTDGLRAAINAFHRQGGNVIVSAGNGGSLGQIQPICGLPGVICVGSLIGGTVLTFKDSFYARKVLPYNGKRLDFALPNFTIAASFNNLDGSGATTVNSVASYKVVGGTSFTGPELAGMLALLMQKYPRFASTPRIYYHMLKRHARPMVQDGVTTYIPNLNFIK